MYLADRAVILREDQESLLDCEPLYHFNNDQNYNQSINRLVTTSEADVLMWK